MRMMGVLRPLPENFNRDVIMKAPSDNMMNTLAKSVLALYSYDDNANDISIPNVLRQCIELINLFDGIKNIIALGHLHRREVARSFRNTWFHKDNE